MQKFFLVGLLLFISNSGFGQSKQITGKVISINTYLPLIGVNVSIQQNTFNQSSQGTTTDSNGKFVLSIKTKLPIDLVISYVGYEPQIFHVTNDNYANILVIMKPETKMLQEVVIQTARVDSSELASDITAQKIDAIELKSIPSFDYYDAVANLREVDFATQSMIFKSVNTRGFNATGNTRFVQIVDGMDNQAPGFNFSLGNFAGINELDVESIELIPGASTVKYGQNAFNGVLDMKSKDPFLYQGVSAYYKFGFNNFREGGGGKKLFDFGGKIMQDVGLRFAKAFNNKLAFKLVGSYLTSEDWSANDYDNIGAGEPYETTAENPGYDGLNVYGDEISSKLILGDSNKLVQVNRTGYREEDLVDYDIYNAKLSAYVAYKIKRDTELSFLNNYSRGTTLFTGDSRIYLKDFAINQSKVGFKISDWANFMFFTTIQNSGNSYDVGLLATGLLRFAKNDEDWFKHYRIGYEGNPAFNIPRGSYDHMKAREFADKQFNAYSRPNISRLEPGTDSFESEKRILTLTPINEGGARFVDNSRLYQGKANIKVNHFYKNVDLTLGGDYRFFDPQTLGTVFSDSIGNDLTMYEFGIYGNYIKSLGKQLKLNGSIRYDKNENFNGNVSTRLSLLYNINSNQNFRISVQSGFRNPSLRELYTDQQFGNKRLIGGIKNLLDYYNIGNNSIYLQNIKEFNEQIVLLTEPGSEDDQAYSLTQAQLEKLDLISDGIVPEERVTGLRPEMLRTFEVGYKNLVYGGRLYIDFNYYISFYKHLIGFVEVVKTNTSPDHDLLLAVNNANDITQSENFAYFTNSTSEVITQGFSVLLDYISREDFLLSANFGWNAITQHKYDPITPGFNTPTFRLNCSIGHRGLIKNVAFKYTLRMRSAFNWESTFASGEVKSYAVSDIQVSIKAPKINMEFKTGFSNIGNEYYSNTYGGPQIGAILYVNAFYNLGL